MESLHLIADIPQKALIKHEGKVLLSLDRKGQWELPGGRLHVNEEPRAGLKRELLEELKLEVEPVRVTHAFVFTSAANGQNHFVVVYECRLPEGLAGLKMDERELRGLKWVGPDDFEPLPMRDGYKEALRKLFAAG